MKINLFLKIFFLLWPHRWSRCLQALPLLSWNMKVFTPWVTKVLFFCEKYFCSLASIVYVLSCTLSCVMKLTVLFSLQSAPGPEPKAKPLMHGKWPKPSGRTKQRLLLLMLFLLWPFWTDWSVEKREMLYNRKLLSVWVDKLREACSHMAQKQQEMSIFALLGKTSSVEPC